MLTVSNNSAVHIGMKEVMQQHPNLQNLLQIHLRKLTPLQISHQQVNGLLMAVSHL